MTTEHVREMRTRTGGVRIVEEADLFLASPHGYVGRRMLLNGLREARSFGAAHPGGWWHVTDTSGVRLVNPLNPFLLRRIQRLPNIRGYVVIAPSRLVRLGMRMVRPLVGQDMVLTTEDEARGWIASRDAKTS